MNLHIISEQYGLTKSELKILQLIAKGKTTIEIATTLKISVKTVESHRYNCAKKLNLDGRKNALIRFILHYKSQG